MISRKVVAVTGFLIGILAIGITILAIPSVEYAIFTRFVRHHLRTGTKDLLKDDALKVLLCGTSAPFADPSRAQACVAIIAGGKYYLVDTGPGSGRNLELWQLRGHDLGAVFLTHFHSDHIGDLGEINTNAWLDGRPGQLPVYGGGRCGGRRQWLQPSLFTGRRLPDGKLRSAAATPIKRIDAVSLDPSAGP